MGKNTGETNHMNVMTLEIWDMLITAVPPHQGFMFMPKEGNGCLLLVVSLENLSNFSREQQEDLALWIGSLCQKVRNIGTPCFIERSDNLKKRKVV